MIARLRTRQGRAVVGTLASSLWIQAFVLVSGIAAARLLGPTDRGHLALIWTVTLTLSQVGTMGLPLAVTYEIARGRATIASLTQAIGWPVLRQIVGITALHATCLAALLGTTSTPSGPAWVSLAVMPAMMLQMFTLAAIQGAHDFRALNLLRTLPVAIYAVVLLAVAAMDAATLLIVTMTWVASYVLAAVATAVAMWLRGREPKPLDEPPPDLAAMRGFGRRGFLGWASPTETFRIDQLIVGLVLSAQSLGLYVAALAFTNLPRFLAQGVGLVAYPAVASTTSRDEMRRVVVRYALAGALVGFTACGVLAALAEPLVLLAFGESFSGAVGPLRVLLVATALLCPRRVLSDALRGAGAVGAGSRAEACSWLMLIPGLLLLAGPFELYGVAVAVALSYAGSLMVLIVGAWRHLNAVPSPSSVRDAELRHSTNSPEDLPRRNAAAQSGESPLREGLSSDERRKFQRIQRNLPGPPSEITAGTFDADPSET